MVQVARFAENKARKEQSEATQQSMVTALPSSLHHPKTRFHQREKNPVLRKNHLNTRRSQYKLTMRKETNGLGEDPSKLIMDRGPREVRRNWGVSKLKYDPSWQCWLCWHIWQHQVLATLLLTFLHWEGCGVHSQVVLSQGNNHGAV